MLCSYLLLFFLTDKMEGKELNDPLNNVSLIEGKPGVCFLFYLTVVWQNLSEWLGIISACLACTWHSVSSKLTVEGRGKKAWVTVGQLVSFEAYSAVDGLVLEADFSSVNNLIEDGVS